MKNLLLTLGLLFTITWTYSYNVMLVNESVDPAYEIQILSDNAEITALDITISDVVGECTIKVEGTIKVKGIEVKVSIEVKRDTCEAAIEDATRSLKKTIDGIKEILD